MAEEIWLPQIDKDLCTGCGDCIVTKPAACNYCGKCETICSVDAVALPYQIVLGPD